MEAPNHVSAEKIDTLRGESGVETRVHGIFLVHGARYARLIAAAYVWVWPNYAGPNTLAGQNRLCTAMSLFRFSAHCCDLSHRHDKAYRRRRT